MKPYDFAVIRDKKITAVVDGVDITMTIEQYNTLTTLVNRLIMNPQSKAAWVDDKGNVRMLYIPEDIQK